METNDRRVVILRVKSGYNTTDANGEDVISVLL